MPLWWCEDLKAQKIAFSRTNMHEGWTARMSFCRKHIFSLFLQNTLCPVDLTKFWSPIWIICYFISFVSYISYTSLAYRIIIDDIIFINLCIFNHAPHHGQQIESSAEFRRNIFFVFNFPMAAFSTSTCNMQHGHNTFKLVIMMMIAMMVMMMMKSLLYSLNLCLTWSRPKLVKKRWWESLKRESV